MKQQHLEKYKNKKAKILLRNGFRFRGEITSIDESVIFVKDEQAGSVTISLSSIAAVTQEDSNAG